MLKFAFLYIIEGPKGVCVVDVTVVGFLPATVSGSKV